MFGQDFYRGNTTPKQRLNKAKEELEWANWRASEAQKKYDAALKELEAFAEFSGAFT